MLRLVSSHTAPPEEGGDLPQSWSREVTALTLFELPGSEGIGPYEEPEAEVEEDVNLKILGQMEILLEGLEGAERREAAMQIYRDADGILRRRSLHAL